jgi:predicted chitinase
MAEVTGSFGDQPIELNNAATESTLRELVAAMGVLSAKVGGKAKGTQDIEKELKKFQEAVKKQTEATKGLTEEQKKALAQEKEAAKIAADKKKADEESLKRTHAAGKALNTLGTVTSGVITGMTNLMSSLANVGNSMESAASAMGAVPVVGGVLASVFGAVAGSAEKLNKAYQTAASAGVTFGGSVNSMVNAASSAGLTFDQFAGLIQKNSESMMLLGGTTEAGAKRFAELGKEMRNSGIGNELLRMGFSTEQINSGMASYVGILGKTGALQNMTTKQIAASSAGYLKDLDALAKITGSTREEKEKEQQALLSDAQFRAATAGMDAEAQKQMMAYITSFPKEQQAAMKDMIATGNITSEESVKLAAMMPGAAQQAMAFGQQLQAGGKISRDSFNQAKNLAIQEAGVRVKEMKDQGLYNKDMGETYVGMANLAAQKIDGVNQAYAEQADSVKKANQAEEIEKFKQRLAETSNVFTQILAQSGLLTHLENAFQLMTGIVLDYVVPGFTFLANNFETVVGVAMGLGAAFLVLKGLIIAGQVVQALQTMGVTLSLGPLAGFAAGVFAATLPLLKFALPIIALMVLFKKLYEGGWTFGSVLEAMGDNLKGFLLIITGGFLSLLDKLTFGDANQKIKDAQKAIDLERDELKEREKARDKKRAEVREERGIKEDEKKESALDRARAGVAAREAETADKKKAEEAKKAAAADKEKADAAAGIPKDVGSGNPLADMALYGKKKVDEAAANVAGAAAGASSAGGVPGTTSAAAGGKPPSMNQDQKKNMDLIEASLKKQGITDPKYIAAVKGNVMKETGGKSIEENLNYGKTGNDRIRSIFGSRAAGKTDQELDAIKKDPKQMGEMMYGSKTKMGQQMGNTEPGDGFKYRGRGFIQLTGKSNYAAASKAIYGDNRLVDNPDLVNDPQVAADVSAWYMKKGQGSMAKTLGIDQGNMSQDQANLLATSQIAGKAIKPGSGYLGGEVLSKVNSYSAAFTGPGGATTAAAKAPPATSVTPTQTAAAAATGTRMVMVGSKSYVEGSPEHKAALEAENSKSTKTAQAPGAAGGKTQESAESLLERLNMQVGELIAVTRETRRLNERQLGVMADNSSNVYAA